MKRALVYNRYLQTAGGGERACLDICIALKQLGYEITLATFKSFTTSLVQLAAVFGITDCDGWRLEKFENEAQVERFCRRERFDLFVNSSFCSTMPNPALVGIYMLMFPQQVDQSARENLRTYNLILSNSEFSKIHLELRWGENFPCCVLPPPISKAHADFVPIFGHKERLVMLVGRFNTDGHCKHQLEAIRAFRKLKQCGVLDEEWRLHLVGNLNPGAENVMYYEKCLAEASSDVDLQTNVPFEQLQNLYARAACLWQFTGITLLHGERPELCEHLGLVALDSLCYGTLPIVFERSGASYIIEYAENGFVFSDIDELASIMKMINCEFGSKHHERLFLSAQRASANLNYNSFLSSLDGYLKTAIDSCHSRL